MSTAKSDLVARPRETAAVMRLGQGVAVLHEQREPVEWADVARRLAYSNRDIYAETVAAIGFDPLNRPTFAESLLKVSEAASKLGRQFRVRRVESVSSL